MAQINITFTVADESIKENARAEAALRGETLSEAVQKSFELGFPLYLREIAPKFQPVPESEPIAVTK